MSYIFSKARTPPANFTTYAALVISVLTSVCLVNWVLQRCGAGFDLTDEGLYLNWISNPWNYRFSVTQFGFVYHLLYKLVGGDVSLLRRANVLILLGLAWLVCFVMLQSAFRPLRSLSVPERAALIVSAFVAATGSLSFLILWLPTPSYNSLTLQSFLLTIAGLLLADRERAKRSLVGWLLIGIGGGIAFLAKPTSAAALGLFALLYVAVAGKLTIRGLFLAACASTMVLVCSALLIDGSLFGFVDRIVGGLNLGSQLQPSRGGLLSVRMDGFFLSPELKSRIGYLVAAYFVIATASFLLDLSARVATAAIAALIASLITLVLLGYVSADISYEALEPILFLVGAAAFCASATTLLSNFRWLARDVASPLVFGLLPFAFAFGTGNPYWPVAARAGFFWYLIAFWICTKLSSLRAAWHPLLSVLSLALVATTLVLYPAAEHPYRQLQPLRLQRSTVELANGSNLLVSQETAVLIRSLRRLAAVNKFEAGDSMLDLTGTSPGLLYALNARPLGAGWLIGGYPGSVDFASASLNQESCAAIAASWILIAPRSADMIPPDFLIRFGIDIRADYQDVGSIEAAYFSPNTRIEYHLLKPLRSFAAARSSCERERRD